MLRNTFSELYDQEHLYSKSYSWHEMYIHISQNKYVNGNLILNL
jgi:hypothetical protein